MDESACIRLARDRLAMLAELHGTSRASYLPTSKQHRKPEPTKQDDDNDLNEFPFPLQSSPAPFASRGYCAAQTAPKRSRLQMPFPITAQEQKDPKILSTCFRKTTFSVLQNSISTPDSDLWILPDFEDWEIASESPSTTPQSQSWSNKKSAEWAPLVERAVRSNQERLRHRLEGDGWDFVGGRHGEEKCALKEARIEESVDEEFDVVVLPPLVRAA